MAWALGTHATILSLPRQAVCIQAACRLYASHMHVGLHSITRGLASDYMTSMCFASQSCRSFLGLLWVTQWHLTPPVACAAVA